MKQTLDVNQIYNQLIVPFRKNLGRQLLQLREENDLTAYQVSKQLGFCVSAADIHDYENGRYHIIPLEILLVLMHIYQKSVRIVFDDKKV